MVLSFLLGPRKLGLAKIISNTKKSENTYIKNYETLTRTIKNYYDSFNLHVANLKQLDDAGGLSSFDKIFRGLTFKERIKPFDTVDRSNPLLISNYNIDGDISTSDLKKEHLIRQIRYKLKYSFSLREALLISDIQIKLLSPTKIQAIIRTIDNKTYRRELEHKYYMLSMTATRAMLKDILDTTKKNVGFTDRAHYKSSDDSMSIQNSLAKKQMGHRISRSAPEKSKKRFEISKFKSGILTKKSASLPRYTEPKFESRNSKSKEPELPSERLNTKAASSRSKLIKLTDMYKRAIKPITVAKPEQPPAQKYEDIAAKITPAPAQVGQNIAGILNTGPLQLGKEVWCKEITNPAECAAAASRGCVYNPVTNKCFHRKNLAQPQQQQLGQRLLQQQPAFGQPKPLPVFTPQPQQPPAFTPQPQQPQPPAFTPPVFQI